MGYAEFKEVARGLISGHEQGMLKMIADPAGNKLLGVHIIGEGATELIHLGQMALINDMSIETFIGQIFNFPTLAEAYRVAALQIRGHLQAAREQAVHSAMPGARHPVVVTSAISVGRSRALDANGCAAHRPEPE
ncbi:MAG: hypothetical protein ACI81O_000704 [Cyclobacteriaceae bacterium]